MRHRRDKQLLMFIVMINGSDYVSGSSLHYWDVQLHVFVDNHLGIRLAPSHVNDLSTPANRKIINVHRSRQPCQMSWSSPLVPSMSVTDDNAQ